MAMPQREQAERRGNPHLPVIASAKRVAIRFPLVISLAPLKGELAAARQTEGFSHRLREIDL